MEKTVSSIQFLHVAIPGEVVDIVFKLIRERHYDFEFVIERGLKILNTLLVDIGSGKWVEIYNISERTCILPPAVPLDPESARKVHPLVFLNAITVRARYGHQLNARLPLETDRETRALLHETQKPLHAHSIGEVITCAILAADWLYELRGEKYEVIIRDDKICEQLVWREPDTVNRTTDSPVNPDVQPPEDDEQ